MRPHWRVRITGMAIALVLASSGPTAAAPVPGGLSTAQAGGGCTAEGAVARRGGRTLTCSKVGKRLVWVAAKVGTSPSRTGTGTQPRSQSDIPAIIQNWGFDLSAYSPDTGKAGAMQIRGTVPPTFTGPTAAADNFNYRNLIGVLGEVIAKDRGSVVEPQLTFIVPLGTPVVPPVSNTKIGWSARPRGTQRRTGPPRSHSSSKGGNFLRSAKHRTSSRGLNGSVPARSSQNGQPVEGWKCQAIISTVWASRAARAAATAASSATAKADGAGEAAVAMGLLARGRETGSGTSAGCDENRMQSGIRSPSPAWADRLPAGRRAAGRR